MMDLIRPHDLRTRFTRNPRFHRWSMRALLALVLSAPMLALAPTAQADLVTLPGGTAAEVRRDGTTLTVFPVQPTDDVQPDKITARLISVVKDGNLQTPIDKITAVWDSTTPAIKVSIPDDAITRPGTYIFNVELVSGTTIQQIPLTFTRATADLTIPSTAKITIVTPSRRKASGSSTASPGAGSTPDAGGSATGASSSGTPIRIVVGPDDKISDTDLIITQVEAEPGELRVTGTTVEGSTIAVAYEATKGFPIGTSTRTLRVAGEKLTTPASIVVTITHRLPLWLIPLVVLLGIATGFVIRNVLVPARDRAKNRAVVEAFLAGPAFDETYSHDHEYVQTLTAAKNTVTALLGSDETDPAKIQTALTAATTTIEEARTKLGDRLTAQRARLDQLGYLASEWTLPADLEQPLTDAQDHLKQGVAALQDRDASEAESALDAVMTELDTLRRAAVPELDAASTQLTSLRQALQPATAPPVADVGTAAEHLAAKLHPTDPADNEMVLEAAHNSEKETEAFRILAATLQPMIATCREKLTANNKLGVELDPAITAYATELSKPDPVDLGRLGPLAASIRGVHHALSTVIDDIAGDDEQLKTEAREKLDQGRWAAAITGVLQIQAAHPQPEIGAAEVDLPATQPPTPKPLPDTTLTPAPAITTPAVRQRRIARRLDLAVVVVLTLVVIVVAMQLYAADWLGTWGQIGTLLAWALALDLVVGGIPTVLAAQQGQVPK